MLAAHSENFLFCPLSLSLAELPDESLLAMAMAAMQAIAKDVFIVSVESFCFN
jgi:hypothetical protein